MSLLAVVELFMATSADVFKGLTFLEVVLVGPLLFASSVVEVHADLIIAHVIFGDTVDVGFAQLFAGLITGWATGIWSRVPLFVLERVVLRSLCVPRLDVLEPGLNECPVGPLKLPHHPRHHHLVTRVENLLVRIVEGHLYEKLREHHLIGQFWVKFPRRGFGQDLRQHAVNELMER